MRDCGRDESTTVREKRKTFLTSERERRERERERERESKGKKGEGRGRGEREKREAIDSQVLMFSENVGSGMAFFKKFRMDFMRAALSGMQVYSTPELNILPGVCCNERGAEFLLPLARGDSVVSMVTSGVPVSMATVVVPDDPASADSQSVRVSLSVAEEPLAVPSLFPPPVVVEEEEEEEEVEGRTVGGRRKGTSSRHWATSISSLSSILSQPPRLWKADISRLVMRSMTLTALVTSWRGG